VTRPPDARFFASLTARAEHHSTVHGRCVMKRWRFVFALGIVVMMASLLIQCRPFSAYLEQVYKVYGHVTVTGTDPPLPLGSVEVFVGSYQYSELTNFNGDYELELPEGTWEITFLKNGYEGESGQVTVGPDQPRVHLDAEMIRVSGAFDLTGYWIAYAETEGSVDTSGLIYFLQSGNTISAFGSETPIYGVVDGASVSFTFTQDEMPFAWIGVLQEDGSIVIDQPPMFDAAWFEPQDIEPSFGSLELSGTGTVTVDTEMALGTKAEDSMSYRVVFDVDADPLHARLYFQNWDGMGPGTYSIQPEEDANDTIAFLFNPSAGIDREVPEGTLTIASDELSGTFDLAFPDNGDFLTGGFALDSASAHTATVTISGGQWYGEAVATGTTSGVYADKYSDLSEGYFEIFELTAERVVSLNKGGYSSTVTDVGTYNIPDDYAVCIQSYQFDGSWPNNSWREEEVISGQLVITEYQKDAFISGYITGAATETGTLSGNFSVPLLLDED